MPDTYVTLKDIWDGAVSAAAAVGVGFTVKTVIEGTAASLPAEVIAGIAGASVGLSYVGLMKNGVSHTMVTIGDTLAGAGQVLTTTAAAAGTAIGVDHLQRNGLNHSTAPQAAPNNGFDWANHTYIPAAAAAGVCMYTIGKTLSTFFKNRAEDNQNGSIQDDEESRLLDTDAPTSCWTRPVFGKGSKAD